jgi:hypothetical protein
LLRYKETNWKCEKGFKIHQYDLTIGTIAPSKTRKEQQAKIEKLSFVAFLNKEQRKSFVNICRQLKQNNNRFYQNKNLHVTVFGFGPVAKKDYETIQKRILLFAKKERYKNMILRFDAVRPGTMYLSNKTLRPVKGISNGSVIAVGDVATNKDFYNYGNQLTRFLLTDEKVKSILGADFRRKFPTVWCTLGYYNKKDSFKIDNDLEHIFKHYNNLQGKEFTIPVTEISLVSSKYKNLRYPKLIQKFKV